MPEIDRNKLAEEFDIKKVENKPLPVVEYSNDNEDPEDIIRNNIDRANRILDLVEVEMANGNFSARMVEVAAKAIDSVSSAASQLQSSSYNDEYLHIKDRMIDLKEREFEHKVERVKNGSNSPVRNQNIIFTDRESVLKALKGNKKQLSVKGENND